MKLRDRAMDKSGGKAGSKSMAAAAAAPKRIAATKRSAPAKKPMAKKAVAAKKPALAKKPAPAVAKAAPPRPAQAVPPRPLSAGPAAAAARPAVAAAARPATAPGTTDERRKAATRKFFARLRSLEAIVGADLRKRGSVVLMQAVDQWYKEAISATATDVSITTAAKAVITHL
jgi:hypothetical protein